MWYERCFKKTIKDMSRFEWGKVQFYDFVWSIIVKRLHLDLTLKQSVKDLEAEMFGS